MKRLILICACVWIPFSALSQVKKLDPGSDTSFYYPFKLADAVKYHLVDIKTTSYKRFYRFWTNRQFVEIWSEDSLNYKAAVSSFIFKYTKRRGRSGLIIKKEIVNPSEAKKVLELYHILAIDLIPVQRKLNGWKQGTDGEVIKIEYATPDAYSYKYYWQPSEQKIVEGITISKFITYLNEVLGLQSKYESFMGQLNLGRYSVGMMVLHIYPTPRKAKGGSSLFN